MLDLSIHLHVKVRIITPPLSSRSTWPVSREQGLCALDRGSREHMEECVCVCFVLYNEVLGGASRRCYHINPDPITHTGARPASVPGNFLRQTRPHYLK